MNPAVQKIEAIVLRQIDYGESDRIIHFITPDHGKMAAFAASANKSQKRFGGALDLFAQVCAHVHPPRGRERTLWRLDRVETINAHEKLRGDLERFVTASYLAECLLTYAQEGDPNARLYSWWKNTLGELNDVSKKLSPPFHFDLELLQVSGYAPQWKQCVECGMKVFHERAYFSFVRGGVICTRCPREGEGRWLEASLLESLSGQCEVPRENMREAHLTLDAYVSFTLGRRPKSQPFREEVLRGSWESV